MNPHPNKGKSRKFIWHDKDSRALWRKNWYKANRAVQLANRREARKREKIALEMYRELIEMVKADGCYL